MNSINPVSDWVALANSVYPISQNDDLVYNFIDHFLKEQIRTEEIKANKETIKALEERNDFLMKALGISPSYFDTKPKKTAESILDGSYDPVGDRKRAGTFEDYECGVQKKAKKSNMSPAA